MAELDRRHGMDDVAKAIGGLEAGLTEVNRRLDGLQLERHQQHTEAIKSLTDAAGQAHEIKHLVADVQQKFNAVDHKIVTHQADDKRDYTAVMERLDRHEGAAKADVVELKQEITANRLAAEVRETKILSRLDDISAWRNRVYGAIGFVVVVLTIFGHEVVETAKSVVHWIGK
jgi:hypothetical protein